jgi:hypothetical protein
MRKLRLKRWQIFLLLPAIIFLFMIGWSLYWIGQQKGQAPAGNPPEFIALEIVVE